MLSLRPSAPSSICLLSTLRCNASCKNCCNGCSPDRGAHMTYEQMKTYIDKSMEAYGQTITQIDLTGGECMLYPADVEKIIEYGATLRLNVSILSNCFWATSYAKAYQTLNKLKQLGLKSMCFSTGEDHQKWVPLRYVRNASVAAARLGLKVQVRVETYRLSAPTSVQLERDKVFMRLVKDKRIDLCYITWMDFNNKTERCHHRKHRWIIHDEDRPCRSMLRDIIITPYGDVMACPGLSAFRNPYMRLGNINKDSVQEVFERGFQDMLKIWLRTRGPADILRYVHDNSNLWIRSTSGHHCDLCRAIFADTKIMDFLRGSAVKWAYNATSRYY